MKNFNMKCKRVVTLDLPSAVWSELDNICSHFDVSRLLVFTHLIHSCYERLLSDPIFTTGRKFMSDSEFFVSFDRVIGGHDR